jgi:ABC-type Mn2+/Zn2+ transport system ATPase subunit
MEDERSRSFLLASIGISEWRMRAIGVVLGNLICSAAGLLVMLKEGQVTANRGFDAFIAVIAAYLLGSVLFERQPVRATGGLFARILRMAAVFRPTTSALLGLLSYFLLLGLVSRSELPSSLPRLLMIALIIGGFIVTRWNDIKARWTLARADRSYLVPEARAFEASKINVSYPGFPVPTTVLHDLSLTVQKNSTILLQGPNGSGKTTLLRYLGGFSPGRGEVNVPSKSASRRRRIRNRRPYISYISQDAQLASSAALTVKENFALFTCSSNARFWRRWKWRTTDNTPPSISDFVARMGSEPAGHLSGGQRQILSIAGVIARPDSPDVVLLDEPLTHLDEENAIACVRLIEDMAAEGKRIIIVQHDIGLDPATQKKFESRQKLVSLITNSCNIAVLQS